MPDDPRIDELRRRLRKDPASIAFAQLAEELRRAGQREEAVTVCRAGLAVYPEYVSARVTLGRALLALDRLDEAQRELEYARETAPENTAAIRALADIHDRIAQTPGEGEAADGIGAGSRALIEEAPVTQASSAPYTDAAHVRLARTVDALEAWLDAIHVARAQRSA